MSVYLIRSLLLSLFIGILVTATYYVLREEVTAEPVVKLKKSLQSWSAGFTLQASRTHYTPTENAFKDAVQRNMRASTDRLKAAGFRSEIKLQNDSTYTIDISGVTDTISIRNLVSGNIRFQFFEVYRMDELMTAFTTLPMDFFKILNPAQAYQDEHGRSILPAHIGICKLEDTGKVSAFFSDPKNMGKFPADTRFMFSELEEINNQPSGFLFLYAIREIDDPLSNRYITSAEAGVEEDEYVIRYKFNVAGTKRWEKMTEKNVGRPIAICINDRVSFAPNVIQKIEGGNSIITMGSTNTTLETCRIMAVSLASEDLLLPVRITDSSISAENLSPLEKLSPVMKYMLAFLAAFAISFCIIWFIFRPGKNAPANP